MASRLDSRLAAAVQKAPALTDIRAMVGATDPGPIGARDRALLLLGFAGAFRRSEMVHLDAEDLDFGRDGLTVILRRSKTDQEGRGHKKVGIPYGCSIMNQTGHRSVQMVRRYIRDGNLFRENSGGKLGL